MAKMMYVWRRLPLLRDYSDGLLCVIASSQSAAVNQAVRHLAGNDETKQKLVRFELMDAVASPCNGDAYEEISVGVVSIYGGS